MDTEQIAERARMLRSDLPIFAVKVTRSFSQPDTAWEGDSFMPWHVSIQTVDRIANKTQLVTTVHDGKGQTLADAAAAALAKMSGHDVVAKINRKHAPLKPRVTARLGPSTDDDADEPESDGYDWVREEVSRRAKEER